MSPAELTPAARFGHTARMRAERQGGRACGAWLCGASAAVLGAGLAGGCITVNAPEEPIVIELNINITQEVIYRLADDVRENIEENPEIF